MPRSLSWASHYRPMGWFAGWFVVSRHILPSEAANHVPWPSLRAKRDDTFSNIFLFISLYFSLSLSLSLHHSHHHHHHYEESLQIFIIQYSYLDTFVYSCCWIDEIGSLIDGNVYIYLSIYVCVVACLLACCFQIFPYVYFCSFMLFDRRPSH